MISNKKIGTWKNPVSALPDQPTLSASALKAQFDSNSNELKDSLNSVIDELIGVDGAENIGCGNVTVKAAIENILSSVSDTYSKAEVDTELEGKVDKVSGKGLSTNDYTDSEKTKLGTLPAANDILNTIGKFKTITPSEVPATGTTDILDDGIYYVASENDKYSYLLMCTSANSGVVVGGVNVLVHTQVKIDSTGKIMFRYNCLDDNDTLTGWYGWTDLFNNKVDKEYGKGLSSNDYSDSEKAKLAGIENNANNYTHPSTHSVEMITETADKKVMTAQEREKLAGLPSDAYSKVEIDTELEGKVDKVSGKGLSTNDYTTEEKTKLGTLPANDILDTIGKFKTITPSKVPAYGTSYILDDGIYYVTPENMQGGYLLICTHRDSGVVLDGVKGIEYVQLKIDMGAYTGRVMYRYAYDDVDSFVSWYSWSEYVPNISIRQQSYISSVSGTTTTYTFDSADPNSTSKVYKISHTNTNTAQFNFSSPSNVNYTNEILIYFKTTLDNAIVWGSNVKFVNDEIPTIEADMYYRIIAEYNPLMSKWVIGVICDGSGA